MPVIAELEFTIGPELTPKAGYPVSPRLSLNGQDELFPADLLKLDLDELASLRAEDSKYEARFSQLFFQAPNIKEAFEKAAAQIDQAGEGNALRIRLLIDPAAQELHHVRWECLRDTSGNPLFNGDTVLFSRFLSSHNLRPLTPRAQLKALIAIASPPNLSQAINPEDPTIGLAPIDVPGEKQRAETGLKAAGFDVLTLAAPPNGSRPATLENILAELENGYDVFYLVCHGGLVTANGAVTPMLWLEDGEDPIDATRLVEGIRNMAHPPRLVVLASCQSAGADGVSAAASGTLSALGPLLATAGVPSVVAMQGNIKMSTVNRFMPLFLSELAKDGHIDRAMGKARGHILDCNDYWMPALFMRLSDGFIWTQPTAIPPSAPVADPLPATNPALARFFTDLSTTTAVLPLEQALDPSAKVGEVIPTAPSIWKLLTPAANMPAYAMASVFASHRILVLGHEGMLVFRDSTGKNPFLDSALTWLKGSRPAKVILSLKPTDTLVKFPSNTLNPGALQLLLVGHGYSVETVATLRDSTQLAQAGIVIIANSWGPFLPQEIAALTGFVNGGGGLLVAGLGWSWPHPLVFYPMNVLMKAFAAQWTAN